MNKQTLEKLRGMDPCPEGLAWAARQPSRQAAWDKCANGNWMFWFLAKRKPSWGKGSCHKKLYQKACSYLTSKGFPYHFPDGCGALPDKILNQMAKMVREEYPKVPKF